MTVTAYPPTVSPVEEIKGRSLWSDAWRRLLHNKAAVVSIVLLFLITLASIFGPLFSSFAYDDVSWDSISIPPDFASGHYFGTDDNGRDLFVRVMYGGRISLTVGIVATLVSLLIGGAACGLVGAFLAVPVAAAIEIGLSRLQAREVPVAEDPGAIETPDQAQVDAYEDSLPDSRDVAGRAPAPGS